MKATVILLTASLIGMPNCLRAENHPHLPTVCTAFEISSVAVGNHETRNGYGILNDFAVLRPITVWSLGMFDSGGDGVQGSAVITIQLFQKGGKKSSLLLETATFDAAHPGELIGGLRLRKLPRPVTLWPGVYTMTANGFDSLNRDYCFAISGGGSTVPRLSLHSSGGLIRFLGCNRYTQRHK